MALTSKYDFFSHQFNTNTPHSHTSPPPSVSSSSTQQGTSNTPPPYPPPPYPPPTHPPVLQLPHHFSLYLPTTIFFCVSPSPLTLYSVIL